MGDTDMNEASVLTQEEQIQAKLINEEYKVWKKNCVFLYDIVYSRALTWPTLTAQWLPDRRDVPGQNFSEHRLLLGTHTSDQACDMLIFANVNLPNAAPPKADAYDPNTGEIGGHGAGGEQMKFKEVQSIIHPGEVNKARYQPQNPDIIATWASDNNVYVWDRTKHSTMPSETDIRDKVSKPQATLVGHSAEGFGLEWSPFVEGQLLSGSNDQTVCLWDLEQDFTLEGKTVKPARQFTHHSATVNDVQYHPIFGKNIFGSVSDDLTIQIIDMRKPYNDKAELVFQNGHSDAINTLAFHPTNDKLFATGSADKTIGIFDLRFPSTKIHSLECHQESVTKVEWHPSDSAILASSSEDRRVILWDLSCAGMEQTPEDAEDGPPEVLFMHGGHTNRVSDFSWNKNDPWVMVSAAEDNLIQIWRPSRQLVEKAPKTVLQGDVSD